jgi:hypothetical protein
MKSKNNIGKQFVTHYGAYHRFYYMAYRFESKILTKKSIYTPDIMASYLINFICVMYFTIFISLFIQFGLDGDRRAFPSSEYYLSAS